MVRLFSVYPEPTFVYASDILEEFGAQALKALRDRAAEQRLRPKPNGYLAYQKRPWRRILAVLDVIGDRWPEEFPFPTRRPCTPHGTPTGSGSALSTLLHLLPLQGRHPTAEEELRP